MKQIFLILLLFFITNNVNAQEIQSFSNNSKTSSNKTSFEQGEWLKFRIHYGFINAGYATLKLSQTKKQGQTVYHSIGKGWTVGAASLFFKIKDNYESYFTKDNIKPIKFKRRVNEGGYIIRRNLYFDQQKNKVTIDDFVKDTITEMSIDNVQDLLSSFYHLRNTDLSNIKAGNEIKVNLFFDSETYPFILKFLQKDIIETKFGKIRTWRIQPLVQKGRVFEGQESLTIWISDDLNKIPIRIKADLVVGSLKADLEEFKGLANPFTMIKSL
ncbi:MAG: DUF3108 domain-containing protein [Bacteroidota bacterium]